MKKIIFILIFLLPILGFCQKSVTGVVTDTDGLPLPGVSIIIKNSSKGTTTDFDGKFNIANVTENNILVFSYLGYLTKEEKVGNRSSIKIILSSSI